MARCPLVQSLQRDVILPGFCVCPGRFRASLSRSNAGTVFRPREPFMIARCQIRWNFKELRGYKSGDI
jgi:hypothetical protein